MLKNKIVIEDRLEENIIDHIALDIMINRKVYDEILNNYDNKDEIARKYKIPLCFLYSRLAREGKIKYNSKDYINNIEKIIL